MEINIYYGKRKITLFDDVNKCDKIKELHSELILFLTNKLKTDLCIYTGNVIETINEIKTYFKYIEAAGGVVFNSKNEMLIIKRLGCYDLPKGKLEKRESAEEGALREVEEECGVSNLKIREKVEASYHIYSLKNRLVLKKTHWYLMDYAGNEKLIPQTEEDITEAFWADSTKKDMILSDTYYNLEHYFKNFL